jgi:hypothetical protein
MLQKQSVQAYYCYFQQQVFLSEVKDPTLILDWFMQGLLPDLQVACAVDNDGNKWQDLQKLYTFACGKHIQLQKQQAIERTRAQSTPHHHKQAHSSSGPNNPRTIASRSVSHFPTKQVKNHAFNTVGGGNGAAEGSGAGAGGYGGGGGRGGGHSTRPGLGFNRGGPSSGGGGPSNNGGSKPKFHGLDAGQRAWAQGKGLCFRCLTIPTFHGDELVSTDRIHNKGPRAQMGMSGWTCSTDSYAMWPPSKAVLVQLVKKGFNISDMPK